MTVLFGHPSGNPNSHHAALAHFEAGWLEAFCVAWMPNGFEIALIESVPGMKDLADRLRRRQFAPLGRAKRVEGRLGEWGRLLRRLMGTRDADERLSYEANDWLMEVMHRECARPDVNVVHAYEDCALLQFEEARRLGKRCIYDLPIGYYPAWESTRAELARKYSDWVAPLDAISSSFVRPEQKRREMELADLVLVPSSFVARTVNSYADRGTELAPYGVDSVFWSPGPTPFVRAGEMRFLFAGQCSARKGLPLLVDAWRAASLRDCTLELVGSWQLADAKKHQLPDGIRYVGPVASEALRAQFRNADILVLPSYFEGMALVILEALASGLPVIASDATGAQDFLSDRCGVVVPAGDLDALVSALRWAGENRDQVAAMRTAARTTAESMSWGRYRARVREVAAPLVGAPARLVSERDASAIP